MDDLMCASLRDKHDMQQHLHTVQFVCKPNTDLMMRAVSLAVPSFLYPLSNIKSRGVVRGLI